MSLSNDVWSKYSHSHAGDTWEYGFAGSDFTIVSVTFRNNHVAISTTSSLILNRATMRSYMHMMRVAFSKAVELAHLHNIPTEWSTT